MQWYELLFKLIICSLINLVDCGQQSWDIRYANIALTNHYAPSNALIYGRTSANTVINYSVNPNSENMQTQSPLIFLI